MSELLQNLGGAVRAARERRGWTQAALAELAGLERTYLTDLEAGRRNPSVRTLEKISKALGIKLHVLFERAERET